MEHPSAEVDIAAIGSMFGDRARVAMLTGMLDRPGSPAGDLGKRAGIAPSTATGHLHKLVRAGLVRVESSGRLRLYHLASIEVAEVIEALGALAPAIPVKSLRQSRSSEALRDARSCYDHLAGRLGVMLHDELLRQRMIRRAGERDYELTRKGEALCDRFGIEVDSLRRTRRRFARACLDWSHRSPHLAGALGAALLVQMLDREWLVRSPDNRSLRITGAGVRGLSKWFRVNA